MATKKKKKKKETKRYETSDGKKFKDKDDARAHAKDLKNKGSSSSSSKAPTVNYTYDSKKETPAQYNARIEKERGDVNVARPLPTGETSTKSTPPTTSSKAPTVNYTYDSKKETAAQYNARIEKERAAVNAYNAPKPKEEEKKEEEKKTTTEKYDSSVLTNSAEFKALNAEDRDAVLAVFDAIASNDQVKAKRLAESFKAAQKINDPYFAQQLRLAADEIERGYVEIGKEAEFKATQAQNRLRDLKTDYEARKGNLSLEEASVMKDIERGYVENLDTLQTGLAEAGFTSSSRRIQKEKILDEATGGLRESKQRAFAYDRSSLENALGQGERDTQIELDRLAELTKAGKLDFLRKAEGRVGSEALGDLNLPGGDKLLGGIYGAIPEEKLQNTISSMQGLVF